MRRLPFLNGVRAFEAAGRAGSFAGAAKELHVTPAAVSRMVKLLEARLGVAVFERQANRLTPTPAGRNYQAGLGPILDALVHLTDTVTASARRRPLTTVWASYGGRVYTTAMSALCLEVYYRHLPLYTNPP